MNNNNKKKNAYLANKCALHIIIHDEGRGGRVGRAQVSKSRGPGFDPTDAVSNLGQVRLPHVALVSKGRF